MDYENQKHSDSASKFEKVRATRPFSDSSVDFGTLIQGPTFFGIKLI